MATDLAPAPAPAPAPSPVAVEAPPALLHAERAGIGLAVRQIWLGAVVVLASIGFLLWAGSEAYNKSAEQGGGIMTALADNPAVRAIYGLPTAISTVGGFTVWRVALFVTLLGTVWIALATTRVLRGNEESGRLDLVLANPISLMRSTVTNLVAVMAVPVLAALLTALVLLAAGAETGGSWLYGAGLGLLLATFAGVAALASQFLPERRRAAGITMGVLFATFVLHMWADGGTNAQWARWLSPFGWLENLHAFGGNETLPLIPLAVAPVVLVAAALALVTRRDEGAGLVRADDTKRGGTAMLSGPLSFSIRQRAGELIAWAAAVAVLGIMSGGLAESLVGFPQTQPQAMQMLSQVGMAEAVTPGGFIAVMNIFYAVVLAGYAISCLHGLYDDEITNRLDLPYSNSVTRTGWSGSTVVTTTAGLVALTVVLSAGTWLGSIFSGAGLSAGDSFSSAANVLPVPVMFLGLAVLFHGIRPSWTIGVVGVLAIGLYLVDLIGPALSWPTWVVDLSPYQHLALVPVQSAAWTATVVILSIAVTAGAIGLATYARRDLQ